MAGQLKLYDDKIDIPTAKAADRFIETQNALEVSKEAHEKSATYLMTLLKKNDKKRIRHGGKLIEIVVTEEKEKIKVKEEKNNPSVAVATSPLDASTSSATHKGRKNSKQ